MSQFFKIIRMYAASWEAMYKAHSSALAADDMTFFIICAMVSMGSLFGVNTVLFDKKKWPPARLHASDSLGYPASVCVESVIWLRE